MVFVTADSDRERLHTLTALLLSTFPGSTVHEHTDPVRSARCVMDRKVDAVLAEAGMRWIDGMSLPRFLRCHRQDIPVFILAESDGYREAALRDGADGYLVWPFTAEQLRSAVQQSEDPDLS